MTEGFRVTMGDTTYEVSAGSLTGRDVKDFRAAVGMTPTQVFSRQVAVDLDVIAGFVWIAKRRQQPGTTYDDVLDTINYDNIVVLAGASDEPDVTDPEA